MVKPKVLFVCTGNSCRSQMAEALTNHFLNAQWEAHSAGTVAVNVGPRQAGRLRSGPFVLDCGEQRGAVARAIRRALAIRVSGHKKNAYGSGRTGRIIARILASAALSDKQRRKRIGY